MEELRQQILALRKQWYESDSIKERRHLNTKINMLIETLTDMLLESPMKIKISYEVVLDVCKLPYYRLIVEDFIETGNLHNAILESISDIKINTNDLKVEIQ